ncbi:MAG: hypothetical protein NTV32_02410 [Gammaproteobacteria bacterium]|nr:hypothetical protein [Gammaproteobacteria bacterium]
MRTESNPLQNFASGVKVSAPWRVLRVIAHPKCRLEVTFMDGVHGYIDLAPDAMYDQIKKRVSGFCKNCLDSVLFITPPH